MNNVRISDPLSYWYNRGFILQIDTFSWDVRFQYLVSRSVDKLCDNSFSVVTSLVLFRKDLEYKILRRSKNYLSITYTYDVLYQANGIRKDASFVCNAGSRPTLQNGMPTNPVSYTHLDVYKRQDMYTSLLALEAFENGRPTFFNQTYLFVLAQSSFTTFDRKIHWFFIHWLLPLLPVFWEVSSNATKTSFLKYVIWIRLLGSVAISLSFLSLLLLPVEWECASNNYGVGVSNRPTILDTRKKLKPYRQSWIIVTK